MFNIQQIEKQTGDDGSYLDVHSVFHTIQGEGPLVGTPAIFVRLAGCNLQCPLCDTDYTKGRAHMSLDHLLSLVKEEGGKSTTLVVITGGEPLRQNICEFVRILLREMMTVQIETNGTLFRDDLPYSHPRLKIVCSPKAGRVNSQLVKYIDAYKYVLTTGQVSLADGLPLTVLDHPASPQVARPGANGIGKVPEIFVQPADHKDKAINDANLATAVGSSMRFGYRLCLQMHKLIGME